MNNSKQYNDIVDLNHVCKNISKISSKIRYVGVWSSGVTKLAGGTYNEAKSYLTEKEENVSASHTIFSWITARTFSHKIGEVDYTIQSHKKVKKFTFKWNNKMFFLISTESDVNVNEIIDETLVSLKKI